MSQLRRLAAQLQQAADQIERLGAFLRPGDPGATPPRMDDQGLVNLLLANQRGAPPPRQPAAAPRGGRLTNVAEELERLAAMVRGTESGAAPGAANDQQLLSALLGTGWNPRAATPEAERYVRLLELLSTMNRG